jgi:transposase
MTAAISDDLRKRIVKAHRTGEGSYVELAERFSVGYATVSRVLRLFREQGHVQPAPHGGGQVPKIKPERYKELIKLVAEKPDRTIDQIRHAWQCASGEKLSRSAMVRALRKAGLTWKKNGSGRQSSSGWTFRRSAKSSSRG